MSKYLKIILIIFSLTFLSAANLTDFFESSRAGSSVTALIIGGEYGGNYAYRYNDYIHIYPSLEDAQKVQDRITYFYTNKRITQRDVDLQLNVTEKSGEFPLSKKINFDVK